MTRQLNKLFVLALLIAVVTSVRAQVSLPQPASVPESLPEDVAQPLRMERAKLLTERANLVNRLVIHNGKCSSVEADTPAATECSQEHDQLLMTISSYAEAVQAFDQKTGAAQKAGAAQFRGTDLVNAMEQASRSLAIPKDARSDNSKRCSDFFRAVGAQLRRMGRPASGPEWTSALPANEIIATVRKDSVHWRPVHESDVQRLANEGVVVIGVSQDFPHGHVAFAFPVAEGIVPAAFSGTGPFIRDGNVPRIGQPERQFPSSWGAVKASKAFDYKSSAPEWYVWMPSED